MLIIDEADRKVIMYFIFKQYIERISAKFFRFFVACKFLFIKPSSS